MHPRTDLGLVGKVDLYVEREHPRERAMLSADKLVGGALVACSGAIFVYYTLWVIVLVSRIHPDS